MPDRLLLMPTELLVAALVLDEIKMLCDVLSDVVSDRFVLMTTLFDFEALVEVDRLSEMIVEFDVAEDSDPDRVVEAAEDSGMLLMLDTRLLSINWRMSPS